MTITELENNTELNLLKTLHTLLVDNSRVAIVGGHYMLLYEKVTDSLKPAIYQEFQGGNREFAKFKTKNFPIKSFEFTVDFFSYLKGYNIICSCILLVNDDSIFKKNFRNEAHYYAIKDRGKELRKKYFSSNDNLPVSYKNILKSRNLQIKDFFHKFEYANNTEESYLPKESIFVSERKLCKSFKKTVKNSVSNHKLFKILKIEQPEADNITELTVESKKVNTVCLISEGVCNCGGKAFQFYYELFKLGYNTVIFFVPDECNAQITEGAELVCSSEEFVGRDIRIVNVSQIDGVNKINIKFYSNSS